MKRPNRTPARKPALVRAIICALALALGAASAHAESVWLSSLDLSHAKITDNLAPGKDKTLDGKTLSINKKPYEKGICVNGYTVFYVELNGGTDKFSAVLGIDDESSVTQQGRGNARTGAGAGAARGADADGAGVGVGQQAGARAGRGQGGGQGRGQGRGGAGSVRYMSVRILGDDAKVLFENNSIALGSAGVPVEIDTKGVKLMVIIVNAGAAPNARGGRGGRGGGGAGAAAHYDLADAKFDVSGVKPVVIAIPGESREVLTPKAGPEPKINGPSLTGVSPGKPVLYKIPASGNKPMTYAVDKLPEGLKLDAATGIISGVIKDKGTYPVTLHAKNSVGEAKRDFKIVAEGTLALTPPLGWNSWNMRGRSITEKMVRDNVDSFVNKGLIDHGWTYINLDDGWERTNRAGDDLNEGPTRDADGNYITNRKFPDMKALGDYIHSKGMKFGIYSSPGPTTCQGLEASFGHEEHDIMQWSSWGVDYLKYDWCSYRTDLEELAGEQKPYQVMRAALDKSPRDMIYSICQYGRGDVWTWGAQPDIRGNLWRTTGDIRDN